MIDEHYTIISREAAEQQDIEESARLWASIDAENAARRAVEYRPEPEPTPAVRVSRGGTAAALAQGWAVDPANSIGNQHPFGVTCADKRCACHGKTFVHFRRGA